MIDDCILKYVSNIVFHKVHFCDIMYVRNMEM